jgi:hypothetical protein
MNESNELAVSIWGIKVTARGLVAVVGAVAICSLLIVAATTRF